MLLGNRFFDAVAWIYDRIVRIDDAKHIERYMVQGSVVDLGGGTGRVLEKLEGNYLGIVVDPSEGMLEVAKRKGLLCIRAKAERLPMKTSSIDNVIVVDAFHHFEDQKQALEECVRILRRGGKLILREPNIEHPIVKFIAFLERIMLLRSRFLSHDDVETLLGRCKVFKEGLFYTIVFEKH